MTGHEHIVEMRRAGQRPAYVWLSDVRKHIPHEFTVHVKPEDVPEHLDLRFLVGTTVLLESESAERAQRLTACCRQYARRVVCTTYQGWHVASVTDTDGVMTWPK